jgi:hypothetical protein
MISRSRSWSHRPYGCEVRFVWRAGVGLSRATAEELRAVEADATACAEHARAHVLSIVPEAEVTIVKHPSAVHAVVRVTAEAIAALEGGPAHRRAAARASGAASMALDTSLFLETDKVYR